MITDKWLVAFSFMMTRYRRKWKDRQALERWQENKLRRHLDKVRKHSSFYNELWGAKTLENWRELPIIDKQIMMEHFDQLNTAGVAKEAAFTLALQADQTRQFTPMFGEITIGLSSGTSGNRGLFLVSRKERLAWAGVVLAKMLPGSLFGSHRIAFFLRANSNLYGTVSGSKLSFSYYDLLEPMEQHLDKLNSEEPTLLVAPPSMLRLLAELQSSKLLTIQPQRIVSVAEVLDPIDRPIIENTFGTIVHQVYQSTEGFLGSTCEHGTLHLNEDIAIIQKEYIDRDLRKFVPIITDFSRFTQPIIRYRLGDVLTERATPCPCGSLFTAIERIEGRCDDVFYFPAKEGSEWVRLFPDFITRAIIAASAEIQAYHVIQHAPERLEICLQVAATHRTKAEHAVQEAIGQLCARVHAKVPSINFAPYSFTPGDRKLRRVERRYSIEA